MTINKSGTLRLVFVMLSATSLLCAQRILYNADLDKKGQDAAAAAKQIASDSLTSREIANLAAIEKQQIDTALTASLNTMRLQIQSFSTWKTVFARVGDVTAAIAALSKTAPTVSDLNERQREIQQSAKDLKDAIAKKKATQPSDPLTDTTNAVDTIVSHLGDVDDLLAFAKDIRALNNIAGNSAITQVEGGLKELDELLKVASAAITSARNVSVDPHTLLPSPEQLSLAVLAAETDSLKERIAIRARAELEKGDVLTLADDTRGLLRNTQDCVGTCTPAAGPLSESDRRIADTLKDGDLRRKEDLLMILFQAASVAAQNQTPATLSEIRDTIAWRRFAMRREAIYNGAYEQALKTASQRLSAYYAAGIKPNQIAQLLYYLSGIVSLPSIAF